MPIFAFPLAFLGLVAAGGLVAVYVFRNLSRRQVVSSLFLWEQHRRASQGGRVLQRIQTPLMFLLEFLAITFFVLAATNPHWRLTGKADLVVILDNSYSMQAIGSDGKTALQTAKKHLDKIQRSGDYRMKFILAGTEPVILESAHKLSAWNGSAETADIDKAVVIASDLAGMAGRIMILTDTPPQTQPVGGRVSYQCFGQPVANCAITGASRTSGDEGDRVLLEIANFSDAPKTVPVTIGFDGAAETRGESMTLRPQQTGRLIFDIQQKSPTLKISLPDDALNIDNTAYLPAPHKQQVSAKLSFADGKLKSTVEKAIAATGLCTVSTRACDLLITDNPKTPTPAGAWKVVVFHPAGQPLALAGPFITDKTHPLLDGVDLRGVIWGAAESAAMPGRLVVVADNTPLLTLDDAAGEVTVYMQLAPELSTLTLSPNWPVLFYNIASYFQQQHRTAPPACVRLGQQVQLAAARPVTLAAPDGEKRAASPVAGMVVITFDRPGLWRFDGTSPVGCNTMSAAESDLLVAASGEVGQFDELGRYAYEYAPIGYGFALAGWCLLMLIAWLLSRMSGGATS